MFLEDEINVKNCTRKDKFLCRDGLRCLDIEYTCDGSCNCFDCSDENGNCSKTGKTAHHLVIEISIYKK